MIPVSYYKAAWHFGSHTGKVTLITPQGEFEMDGMDGTEFHAIVDVLRNERPIYFNPSDGVLETLSELVGEGELS
ncbi:MAG: hypothetical protein JST40_00795 [Armatimonadetes bacterium]|nr:hypothetical protein [Armatimonadota bacterium]